MLKKKKLIYELIYIKKVTILIFVIKKISIPSKKKLVYSFF